MMGYRRADHDWRPVRGAAWRRTRVGWPDGLPWSSAPWLWAAGPTHDVEAALCAGTVFIVGLALVTVRGTRDRVREPS